MNYIKISLIVYIIAEIIAILSYMPRIKLWFDGFKKQKRLKNHAKNKFCLVIAARDESKTIMPLFKSINSQTYDKNLISTKIIVKDKTDPTIEMAKCLNNSEVFILENQTKKADALDFCFKKILANSKESYDAYLIVDADNILTNNYVEEMNNALITGADIIIGRKRIKNWESKNKKNRNLIANISALTYTGIDTMGNKGRAAKGHTLNLCGQGMLVKSRVIEKLGGYPYETLTEDYELGIDCIRKGFKTYYYEYAEIYAEESPEHKVYNQRRLRWLKGHFQVDKKYRKEVLQITFGGEKIDKRHLGFLFGIYPLFFIFGFTGVAFLNFLIAGFYFLAVSNFVVMKTAFMLAILMLFIVYFYVAFYAFICVLQDSDINKMTALEKINVVFFSPLILLEYAVIYFRCFFSKKEVVWEKTKRIGE